MPSRADAGESEHNALGEVPGGVRPDHGPEAIPVVNDKREQNADQKYLQKAQLGHAGISHMQRHEYQCISDHGNCRPAVPSAQLLIEITPVYNLLRA